MNKIRTRYFLQDKYTGQYIAIYEKSIGFVEYHLYDDFGYANIYLTVEEAEKDRKLINDFYPEITINICEAAVTTTITVLK